MTQPPPSNTASAGDAAQVSRQALRRRLLADREQFVAGPDAPAAHHALAAHLARVLREIEPELLGVYWPLRGEFNAMEGLEAHGLAKLPLALPCAQRRPPAMHYRAWNGQVLTSVDECGLPAPSDGPWVVPDVVLLPCVGYTRSGFRLGYGGGYFDRWLAQQPQVTPIGIAWALGEITDETLVPQPHDRPLMVVVTERGVVA